MIRFSISLPIPLHNWLKLQAIRHNRSMGGEVRAIIEMVQDSEFCHDGYHIRDRSSDVDMCRCGKYILVMRQ